MSQQPTVGRTVHYVSHGTPVRSDGSQAFRPACRAALITEVDAEQPDRLGLSVANPTGLFFHPLSAGGCAHDESYVRRAGSWHWPEADLCLDGGGLTEASAPRRLALATVGVARGRIERKVKAAAAAAYVGSAGLLGGLAAVQHDARLVSWLPDGLAPFVLALIPTAITAVSGWAVRLTPRDSEG